MTDSFPPPRRFQVVPDSAEQADTRRSAEFPPSARELARLQREAWDTLQELKLREAAREGPETRAAAQGRRVAAFLYPVLAAIVAAGGATFVTKAAEPDPEPVKAGAVYEALAAQARASARDEAEARQKVTGQLEWLIERSREQDERLRRLEERALRKKSPAPVASEPPPAAKPPPPVALPATAAELPGSSTPISTR